MSNNNNSEFISLNSWIKTVRAKWYWVLISVVVCCAIGALSLLLIRPIYQVKANIMLSEQSPMSKFISAGLGAGISNFFGGNASTEDEIRILTSHTILESVVEELDLNVAYYKRLAPKNYQRLTDESPLKLVIDENTINTDTLGAILKFKVKVNASKKASVSVTAGKTIFSGSNLTLPAKIATDYGTFVLESTPELNPETAGTYRVTVTSPSIAAEELREDLKVDVAGKSSKIITLVMYTDNEQLSIDILNTLIKKYNQSSRTDLDNQNSTTVNFINDRLGTVRVQLANAESNLAQYKENRGLAMIEADGTSYYEKMGASEKALMEQELLTEKLRLTLDMARASAKDNSMIPPMEDAAGAGLIDSYNSLLMRRASLETSSKPDNVALQRLDEQITLVRNNLINTLESGIESSKKIEKQYRDIYNRAMGNINSIPEIEESYRKVARQQAIEEEIYLFLLKKQEEIQVLFANLNAKAKIIDEAYSLQEDISRTPMKTMAISLLAGLLIPLMYFYFRNDEDK